MNKLRAMAAFGLVLTSSMVACNNGDNHGVTAVPNGVVATLPPTPPPSPSVRPSATATATATATGSPRPTTSPTVTPSASPRPTTSPTPVPTSTATALACAAAPAAFGPTYYTLLIEANVPAGGGAVTPIANGANWTTEVFSPATPPPTTTPGPTPTPTTTPTPTPPRPFYVYGGTYHVTSTTAPTDGCVTLITTIDGSPIRGQTFSALGSGSPNPPATLFTVTATGFGAITALSLNVSPSTNTNGTFTLSNGDSGNIAITSVQTVQLPLSRIRIPR